MLSNNHSGKNGNYVTLVSISSTLYMCIFCTNVISAAFSSYLYITCTWKKLPKQYLYEKFVRKNVDEIHTWVVYVEFHSDTDGQW